MQTVASESQSAGILQTIRVTREIFNADSVYVIQWLIPDGGRVEPGTVLCELETSKAAWELESEKRGYLRQCVRAGEEVSIGGVLAYITAEKDTPIPLSSRASEKTSTARVKFSAKAKERMEEFGIDPGLFSGYRFVREEDVLEIAQTVQSGTEPLRDPRGPFRIERFTPVQRRVAEVMRQSKRTIPVAYLDREIDLLNVYERAKGIMQASKVLVTPADLLVTAVAQAAMKFPRFNSFVSGEDELHLFKQVNVGVAVDVESDLYLVVVRNAQEKSPVEIAKELRALEYRAHRRSLRIEDVTGGTITTTSLIGLGVHRLQPIPYPEQTAIIGLAASGPHSGRAILTLGFDHRIANGSQAALFLGTIDEAIRSIS